MKKNKNNNTKCKNSVIINKNGFTLVELIVSLALVTIVVGLLFSFFINYINANNKINDKMEIQAQGRKIMNIISDKIMSCNEIVKLCEEDNMTSEIDLNIQTSKNISVINLKADAGKYNSFVLRNNKLYYQYIEGNDSTKIAEPIDENIVCKYITKFNIEPLENKSFNIADFVCIKINFIKNSETYEIKQNIHLRNKN